MKRATLLLVLLAGCAVPQQQQATLPSYPPANLVNPQPKPVNVPPDPLSALSPDIRDAILSGKNKPLHEGISTLHAYSPHTQPVVNCAVLRVTEVQLNPDEHIKKNGIAIGDAVRWQVEATDQDVLVKPTDPGIATDLIVLTDKRSYHLTLHSTGSAMSQVAYYYPDDISRLEAERQDALRRSARQAADPIPSKPLNFAYRIEGPSYSWRPIQAFDDRDHLYVQFPNDLDGADMPVLYVNQDGHNAILNYEIKGQYLVADRLVKHAVLSSGTGSNRETVRIEAQ